MSKDEIRKDEIAGGAGQSAPVPDRLWHRPAQVDRFGPKPQFVVLDSSPEERAAIAAAFDCLSVPALSAKLELRRRGKRLEIGGEVRASVEQSCVVTLEPVSTSIRTAVEAVFAPQEESRAGRATEKEREETLALGEEDPPEPIINGEVDLGAVALEFFALALDPYPRKPGAQLAAEAPSEAGEHPFAALKALKSGGEEA